MSIVIIGCAHALTRWLTHRSRANHPPDTHSFTDHHPQHQKNSHHHQMTAGKPHNTARHRYPRYPRYTARRVPETLWLTYGLTRLAPLVGGLIVNAGASIVAEYAPMPARARQAAHEFASAQGAEINQRAQRVFFDEPGLDALVIQAAARCSTALTRLGRTYLRARIALHLDPRGVARHTLPLVPRGGYESLMATLLVTNTVLGRFRSGAVSVRHLDNNDIRRCGLHRREAPANLTDVCADIDDVYLCDAPGAVIKITRLGNEGHRRWVVSIAGTAHIDYSTTQNPADSEANIRETLGLPSGMREGVAMALTDAMRRAGVTNISADPVMIAGHSQGGMVALGLLDHDPQFRIYAVITLGTPGRRIRVPDNVLALSVEHDQDVIPAFDARPRRRIDNRVVATRSLNRPARDALYYAHSSTTYTHTMQVIERRSLIESFSRQGRIVAQLRKFITEVADEESHVSFYEIRQEVVEGSAVAVEHAVDFLADVVEAHVAPLPGTRKKG